MYGAQKTTQVIDDNGSTITTAKNIVNDEVVRPVRQYYEVKTRVHNEREEHEAYIEFSDDLRKDKSMLDPNWRIERSKIGNDNGYYYVVRCWTCLEY